MAADIIDKEPTDKIIGRGKKPRVQSKIMQAPLEKGVSLPPALIGIIS